MTAEQFFRLLLDELQQHEALRGYYRFLNVPGMESFRKAYYLQRLKYLENRLTELGDYVWDCGCGYGTTNLFLALNGIRSFGNTLEYYYAEIPKRMDFWSSYGDTTLFEYSYADTFDLDPEPDTYSAVVVQDTLHHLEPIDKALSLFNKCLHPGGVVLAIEENGSNLIQTMKLFRQRGFKRIIEYEDPNLGKTVRMGNENIRSVTTWRNLFERHGFIWDNQALEYLRILPPAAFRGRSRQDVVARERNLIARYPLLRKYFAFGINFIARKPSPSADF